MDIRAIRFETRYTKGQADDWVVYGNAANLKDAQTEIRVRFLDPENVKDAEDNASQRDAVGGKLFHMNAVWSKIKPAYDAWKSGQALPETGTPLQAWSAIDKNMLPEFAASGIKTIEDLAGLREAQLVKIRLPNIRTLSRMASEYIEGRDKTEMAAKMAEMQEQLAAAMALLEEKNAPKKRGPKPKDETSETVEAA